VKLRRHKHCVCKSPKNWEAATPRQCRYGRCTDFICPDCGRTMGGWGKVGCKCQGEVIRWLDYPEMCATKYHAPVKPSLAARLPNRRR
jgi:hypothetical protein